MPEKHIFYSLPAPICVESLIYIVAATHPRRLYSGVSYDFWVLGYLEEGSHTLTFTIIGATAMISEPRALNSTMTFTMSIQCENSSQSLATRPICIKIRMMNIRT